MSHSKFHRSWECRPNVLEKIIYVASDANFVFEDLCQWLQFLGFDERTRGSHHLFRKSGITELMNLQREGSKATVYQVRQVRAVLFTYRLAGEGDED